jgi:hypothetical protein
LNSVERDVESSASRAHHPPALLALGSRIANGSAEWRTSDIEVAELAEDALHSVAFDVTGRAEVIRMLERKGADYLRLALAWLDEHSDHPWQAKLRRGHQAWLAAAEEDPCSEAFVPPSGYFGNGVWRPRRGGLETTTMIEGWPSQWRVSYSAASDAQPQVRLGTVQAGARVIEVNTADDWRRVTVRYPQLVERMPLVEHEDVTLPAPLYLPDWSQVASDWDGVRMTMAGILASAFVVSPVLDGYTVFNDLIADERTLWVNAVVDPVGTPTSA